MDYILLCKRDVDLDINLEEVEEARYVSRRELRELLATSSRSGLLVTPWFRYIGENFLETWWDRLDSLDFEQSLTIHRAGDRTSS